MRAAVPFIVILVPFALLFGVVATEAGLSIAQVMGFAVLVIAGASQFTAVQLLNENAPAVLVLLASLAVNLRMAMYSAALTPEVGAAPLRIRALMAYVMVDQVYVMAQNEYDARPKAPVPNKVAFYLGSASLVIVPWYVFTWVGAVSGQQIPPEFALDFALPIVFIAMIAPALRTRAHIAAAGTSVVFSLLFAGLPSGLGLLLAGILAMHVGARLEARQKPKP
ncbi:MAG: AzlC family ABC transporter permease [Pseudomonadota bacterium]